MIAFFDTNIYIDYLKGAFPKSQYDRYFHDYIIRMCPVVYLELTRGIRSEPLKKKIEQATKKIIFLPPPTNRMWVQAGLLAAKVMGSYDEKTLEKIQNDLLIALTARENGAVLITQDHHFNAIRKHVSFQFQILSHLA